MLVAAYGVRGIGSIHSLGYATSRLELVNEGQLCATIAVTIGVSTIVRRRAAGAGIERIMQEGKEGRSSSRGGKSPSHGD